MATNYEIVFPVKIKKNTAMRLKNYGVMGDSYDSIINKLVDFYDKNKSKGGKL